ncbi:hypothetical protein ACWCQK_38225 [Streptomyces sp. NPDC002306]
MHHSPSPLLPALLGLAVLAAVLLAALAGLIAGLLVHWDGASPPAALLRAGMAFGGTFTVLTALLTLIAGALL